MESSFGKEAAAKRAVIAGLTRNHHEKECNSSLICVKTDKLGLETYSMKIPGQARNDELVAFCNSPFIFDLRCFLIL